MSAALAIPPGLASLIDVDQARGCWTWKGRVDRTGRGAGYGRIGRAERAHLIVYTLFVGPIGRGRELDHTCHNRACVNPAHLEPVTHAENMRRNRKAKCARGHALEGENAEPTGGRNKQGVRTGRTCRACRRARRRARRAEGWNA